MSFARAFQILLALEGPETHDPNDPGGRTKFGIAEASNPDLWANGPPTLETASERYVSRYWAPLKCDALPWPLSYFVFDTAVNQGPEVAGRLLQKSVGVKQDGLIGQPRTLRAVPRRSGASLHGHPQFRSLRPRLAEAPFPHRRRLEMKTLFVALACFALTGCASIPLNTESVATKLVVQAATMKFIERGDAWPARAAAISAEVAQARVLVDFDGVTLADIQTAVIRRLQDQGLPPSDMVLAMAVVELASADLNTKIGEGVLSPEQRVTVNTVLSWVDQAASFY
jgi:hypothetical protein